MNIYFLGRLILFQIKRISYEDIIAKLTRTMAHPVGKNAIIAANRSDTVRPQTTNKTVMTDMKPRKSRAFSILNISWKSVPNFRLPMETNWQPHATEMSENKNRNLPRAREN